MVLLEFHIHQYRGVLNILPRNVWTEEMEGETASGFFCFGEAVASFRGSLLDFSFELMDVCNRMKVKGFER